MTIRDIAKDFGVTKRTIYYLLENLQLVEGMDFTRDDYGNYALTEEEAAIVTKKLAERGKKKTPKWEQTFTEDFTPDVEYGFLKYAELDNNFAIFTFGEDGVQVELRNIHCHEVFRFYMSQKYPDMPWELKSTKATITVNSLEEERPVQLMLVPLKVLRNEILSRFILRSESPELELENIKEVAQDLGEDLLTVGQNLFSEQIEQTLTPEGLLEHFKHSKICPLYLDQFTPGTFNLAELLSIPNLEAFDKVS